MQCNRKAASPESAALAERHTLRIFHISDLHAREGEADSWRRRRVLGTAWERNLDEVAAGGPIDLVCFTGDAAFSGKPGEYAEAGDFLLATLDRLNVPRERLFVVPGNHDIDRKVEAQAWKALRKNLGEAKPSAVASWLAGAKAPFGFRKGQIEKVLARQAAYRSWVAGQLGRPSLAGGTLHPLAYREALDLGLPFPVHVLGLDSAWLCGDENDAKNLRLTDAQVMRIATDERGDPLPGFRLALMHHPFDELADGSEVRRLLAERIDLVLRGHLHEAEPQIWSDPERTLAQLPAGCLYEHDTYPNACQVIELKLTREGRLAAGGTLWFRGWSGRGHWYDDNSLYRGTVNGRLPLASLLRPGVEMALGTADLAPPPTAERIFVGRKEELAALEEALLGAAEAKPVAICAVQGMPGVGKTYLAEQLVALHAEDFPGGLARLALDPTAEEVLTPDRLLSLLADKLVVSPAPAGLAERLRSALSAARALVLIENVDSAATARAVAPLAQHLGGCPLLVTGRYRELGRTPGGGWRWLELAPLEEGPALEQLRLELAGYARKPSEPECRELVRELGYLPLAIHLAAGYLRLRTVAGFRRLLRERKGALRPSDPADLAFQGRTHLAATFEISLELLRSELGKKRARLFRGFMCLGFAPAGGFGASLGAAVAGIPEADLEELAARAGALSLLDTATEREDLAWKIHPLLAELLRHKADEQARSALDRMTGWFVERLPRLSNELGEEQGRKWKEVQQETEALIGWLPQVPAEDRARVERAGSRYAIRSGPFSAWVTFCETALAGELVPEERSHFLWTLAMVASRSGLHNRTLTAAWAKIDLDSEREDERGVALAWGVVADIWQTRGELDEALRIRHEEELPVFEKLDDARERARTRGQIADILKARGDLDEALCIYQELLPVFKELGDTRLRAVTIGRIADIFQTRGEFDEALRIRCEALPVYEKLGDVRSRAVTMGQVADIFQARGELDEALRIRREEEVPIYEKLGAELDLVRSRSQIGSILLARSQDGDREAAHSLLLLALAKAREMKLPEAGQIETVLERHGLPADP